MTHAKFMIWTVLLVLAIAAIAGCTGTSNTSNVTPTPDSGVSANTTMLSGTPPDGAPPNGTAPGSMPPGSGSGSSAYTLRGVYTVDGQAATQTGATYASNATDVSAVYATNGSTLTLANPTVTKSGDSSSEDNSNFAGLNAGVLATNGSTVTVNGGTVTTDAGGANGVFSTGTGTTVYLNGLTIGTSKDSSRGVDVTYGGTIVGKNLTITTRGAHCAAIASDRGEGTEIITGGTMTTAGDGSPGIYSTGNFTVSNATLEATGSEAAVIEGKNSIALVNTTLSGALKDGVMVYQSTSGDAGVGTGRFTMTGGSLAARAGPIFYVTNTNAAIKLTGATITGTSGVLLNASADRWGASGSNGGIVNFTADDEALSGSILADGISTINATMQNGTTLVGSINPDNTAKSVALALDSTSKWNVTGDSTLTSLTDSDSTLANIEDNGHTIYYDASSGANGWLGGKTYTLAGGGKLTPK